MGVSKIISQGTRGWWKLPTQTILGHGLWQKVAGCGCQSLRLDTNTLAHSVEAFLKAMLDVLTLLRDRILHFPESDACTKPLEMWGLLEDMFPAFWDLFRTPDEDLLANSLVMCKVQTEYKVTICLHDLPVEMMSRKGQMGELQLESFEGVTICSVKGASEHAVHEILGLTSWVGPLTYMAMISLSLTLQTWGVHPHAWPHHHHLYQLPPYHMTPNGHQDSTPYFARAAYPGSTTNFTGDPGEARPLRWYISPDHLGRGSRKIPKKRIHQTFDINDDRLFSELGLPGLSKGSIRTRWSQRPVNCVT